VAAAVAGLNLSLFPFSSIRQQKKELRPLHHYNNVINRRCKRHPGDKCFSPPHPPLAYYYDVCVGTNSSHLLRMCGRYRRTTKEEELARIYSIPIPKQPDLPVSYNIAPSQNVLAIRFNPETVSKGELFSVLLNRPRFRSMTPLPSLPNMLRNFVAFI
jgi:hypothetical protein